jgi:2-polyprenyl-6-methoxyphenol hydroxylase-like FAD-dependent oxidoreductase
MHDVIIIGAGPVGLLAAALAGRAGLRVLVLERRVEPLAHSQAIGITPPSLEILEAVGLAEAFVREGLPIRDCHVHGPTGGLGAASFRHIGGRYPFVLSLPQQITLRLLEDALAGVATAEVRQGVEVTAVTQESDWLTVGTSAGAFSARYVLACDGCHSRMRGLLGIRSRTHHYARHFLMGDFTDHSGLAVEAHLFFMPQGAVESFPLPGGRRRWIVQTEERISEPPPDLIARLVRERCGIGLDPAHQINHSAFSPWRLDCERLFAGRVLLCGDAAHVMSPIGGQGMNTGFADAEFAAALLVAVLQRGDDPGSWLRAYDRCRRASASAAASRAAAGMALGTLRGLPASLARDALLRFALFRGPLASHLGKWFAMRSLPYHRLNQCAWAAARLPS